MIVIVNYGMGNLGSIANMIKKAGHRAIISSDHEAIRNADKLILPGVGAFDNGMKNLADLGLIEVLNEQVLEQKKPVLGLCLGMQLMTRSSEEGLLPGLGWLDAKTVRFHFEPGQDGLKIPHMGWNTVCQARPHPIFEGLDADSRFYFVHSFHLVCRNPADVLGNSVYGYGFASAVSRVNMTGMQFHPEKSHKFGLRLLKNFAERVQ